MASLFLIVIGGLNVLINKTGDKVQPCLVPQAIWNQDYSRPGRFWTAGNTTGQVLKDDFCELLRQKAWEQISSTLRSINSSKKNKEALGWLFLVENHSC